MKTIIFKGVYIYLFLLFISCSKMNDLHDQYLKEGEILYIGRVDSAKIFPGNERFLLRFWITDPRSENLTIYWRQKQDSILVTVPKHHPLDSIDIIIGNEQGKIPEGSHTFQLVCTNGKGLSSMVFEKIGNIYGQQFAQTLSARKINKTSFDPTLSKVNIDWGISSSNKEIGVEIQYADLAGEQVLIKIPNKEMKDPTILTSVDITKNISYRTMFLPEVMAIDTFYTDNQAILLP